MSDQTQYNFTAEELEAAFDKAIAASNETSTNADDVIALFGEAGPIMVATVAAHGDDPVTFCMGVTVGLKLAEKYKATLEKIALPYDDPEAIKNSVGYGDDDTMTVLDRAEKMQTAAREALE